MSVIHCSPDFYATLLEIFKTYECELTLFNLYGKYQIEKPKTTNGITEDREIPKLLIVRAILANSANYNQRYPDSIDSLIATDLEALEYLQLGETNHDYLKLAKVKPELIVQAMYYWLYQTGDYQDESQIYKLVEQAAYKYAFHIATKRLPFCWGIPSLGDKINLVSINR